MNIVDDMYSVRQIGKFLKLHSSKVYTLIRSGKLKATNVSTGEGRATWRVSKEDFDSFMASRKN